MVALRTASTRYDPHEVNRVAGDLRLQVEAELGKPTSRGSKWSTWPCPFHHETHGASLMVCADGWKCAGKCSHDHMQDAIAWHRQRNGWTFGQTVDYIMGTPAAPLRTLPTTALVISKSASAKPPVETWQRAALAAIEAAEAYLWSDQPDAQVALAYLRARGLHDETIRRYRLGYTPRWQKTTWLKDDGKPASLPPGVVIPWIIGGELWKVNVRCRVGGLSAALGIPDDTTGGKPSPKYLQLAGGNNAALYNADAIQPGQPALIAEGEFDALIAMQDQDVAAPVTFGSASNGVAPRWAKMLAEAGVVLAALDNDEAGAKGKARIVEALPDTRVISVPGGKDVTEYAQRGGDVRAWIVGELERLSTAPQPAPSDEPEIIPFFDHFPNGLDERWKAWLRRMAKHAPLTVYIWEQAIHAGLHGSHEAISAEQVADYHIRLGRANESERQKLIEQHLTGLEKLHVNRLLTTESNTPFPVVKSRIAYHFRDFNSAYQVVMEWADPRLEQAAYPGFSVVKSRDDDKPTAIRRRLQARHFTGQAGYSEDEATTIAADIAAHLALPPDENDLRARHRLTKHRLKLASALLDPGPVTPFPPGVQFSDYSQFDAARYRTAVESIPESADWSQSQWIAHLGVSKGTLINSRADAGLHTKQRYKTLSLSPHDQVQAQVSDYAHKVKGKPTHMDIYDARTRQTWREPYKAQAAQGYLRAEHAVDVRFQVASLTEIDPAGPRERSEPESTKAPVQVAERDQAMSKPDALPRYGAYTGPGFSKAWLWSQLVLHLLAAGHAESEVTKRPLNDLIAVARGKAMWTPVEEVIETEPEVFIAPASSLPFVDTPVRPVAPFDLDAARRWCDRMEAEYRARHPEQPATLFEGVTA